MGRQLKQVRWVGSDTSLSNVASVNSLKQASTFNISNVIQIGIQAPENTIFYVSGASTVDTNHPIKIGRTQIFEWSVEGTGTYINSFAFGGTLDSSKTYIVDFYLEDNN